MNKPPEINLIATVQEFVATAAIGPNAVRNQGKGVLSATQGYLKVVSLCDIPDDAESFAEWLDEHTDGILKAIKKKSKKTHWGTARKALNLFLRDCFCNHYLRKHYKVRRVENWLEMPLDRLVANALKRHAGRGRLPQWPGLINLVKEDSDKFQAEAETWASELGLSAKVHLDMVLWLANR